MAIKYDSLPSKGGDRTIWPRAARSLRTAHDIGTFPTQSSAINTRPELQVKKLTTIPL